MVEWIIEPPETVFEIKKVAPEPSRLNVDALVSSQKQIARLILTEKDYSTALKLQQIYKSLGKAINKSL